jgi:hypothetical protein
MTSKSIYPKFHYVYRITNLVENKHYYGKRSSKVPPEQDLGKKYFSSSHDKQFIQDQKQNPQNYRYKVVARFDNVKSSIEMEIKLHEMFDVGRNPKFYNKAKQTSTGWDTTGVKSKIIAKDSAGKIFHVDQHDPRWLSGELVGVSHGTVCIIDENGISKRVSKDIADQYKKPGNFVVTVRDTSGNCFGVPLDDPDYLSGKLVPIAKDQVTVIDDQGNIFNVTKDDPRYISGELQHMNKCMVTVFDHDHNIIRVRKDDPRYLSGELKGTNSNKVSVKDEYGNTKQVSLDDPEYLSGKLVSINKDMIIVKDKNGNRFRVQTDDPDYLSGKLVGQVRKTAVAIEVASGKKLGRVSCDDPRWKTKEIVGHRSKLAIALAPPQ